MDGAVYALLLNTLVALLFAASFAVIRLSYPGQDQTTWFCVAFLIGMLTPLSELGVRFGDHQIFFMAASYATLLLSFLALAMGLAAFSGQRLPWRTAGGIFAFGIISRVAIWGGTRDNLGYEIVYQAPFAAGAVLGTIVAGKAVRRGGGKLWLGLTGTFGFLVLYQMLKPFLASAFGSGANAVAYASSRYALFSQATAGVLIVTIGLLIMLIVVQAAMGQTLRESESDVMAGIANRRGFERKSAIIMAEAQRTGLPLSVIVFDLDRFKAINDSHGHSAGDVVIKAFSNALKTHAPPSAVIARLGGDEFVMVLDRTALRAARQVAEAVRRATIDIGSPLPVVTVSGGVAELEAGETFEALLKRADSWAYAAKNNGRNQILPTAAVSPPPLRIIASNS